MTNNKTSEAIKVGDRLTHIDGTWPAPMTVRKIDRVGTDVRVWFVEGGFWQLDRLKKVN